MTTLPVDAPRLDLRWPQGAGATPAALQAYLVGVHPDDRTNVARAIDVAHATIGEYAISHRTVDARGVRAVLWVGRTTVEPDGLTMAGHLVDLTAEQARAADEFIAESVTASDAHRAVIERAKGVIMAELHLDEADAFTALRQSSNEANVKLRLVAELVVRERSSRGIVRPPVRHRDRAARSLEDVR